MRRAMGGETGSFRVACVTNTLGTGCTVGIFGVGCALIGGSTPKADSKLGTGTFFCSEGTVLSFHGSCKDNSVHMQNPKDLMVTCVLVSF